MLLSRRNGERRAGLLPPDRKKWTLGLSGDLRRMWPVFDVSAPRERDHVSDTAWMPRAAVSGAASRAWLDSNIAFSIIRAVP